MKTVWLLAERYQWNRTESPILAPRKHAHLTFNEGPQVVQCRRENLFIKWCWKQLDIGENMNLDLNLTPYKKRNTEWIVDWNIKCKIMTVSGKKKVVNWIASKLKTFAPWDPLWRGWKAKLQTGRKYLQSTYLTEDSYREHKKNSQNSTVKKQAN